MRAFLIALTLLAACAGPVRRTRADAQVDLARAYLKEGNTEAAVVALRRAMEYQRHHWAAWNHMGLALMQKGRIDEAEKAFKKAVRYGDGRAEPYVNYGVFLFSVGRVDEAIEQYELSLDDLTYRNTSLVMSNLGYALYVQGRNDEAAHMLQQALERAPNFCTARYNLGLVERARQRPEAALKVLEQALLMCGDEVAGAYLEAGEILMERGSLERGTAYLRRVIALEPETPLSIRAQQILDQPRGEQP